MKAHYSTIVKERNQKQDELLHELDNAINHVYDIEDEAGIDREDHGHESEI